MPLVTVKSNLPEGRRRAGFYFSSDGRTVELDDKQLAAVKADAHLTHVVHNAAPIPEPKAVPVLVSPMLTPEPKAEVKDEPAAPPKASRK